ncbi:MAG: hypothetical protein L0191_03480, partial [Acidobacteria bacterium]|nr:hypothetical protein [Acidobacteriota bacterium]
MRIVRCGDHEPGGSLTGHGSLPLQDLYEAVLEEGGAREVKERLEGIEDRLWFGREGEPSCLARELTLVREEGERRRKSGKSRSPDLLILILGYSPDPLLLAVAHHA